MTTIRIDETMSSKPGAFTVKITADPLVVETDPAAANLAISAAIARGIGDAIRGIQQMARDGKHRAFNRTGKLAAEIAAVLNGSGYDIVAPAGYLEDDALFDRLVELVPAIADPTLLEQMRVAVEKAMGEMVTVAG